jgi:hypothetical protein
MTAALIENDRANNADLVRLVQDGRILLGAYGQSAPTGVDWDPSADLTANNRTDFGYYTEDGFVLSPNPGDNTQTPAHNGDIVIDQDKPGNWTVQFTGLEETKVSTEVYFDATVDGATGSLTISKASIATYRDLVTVGITGDDDLVVTHYPRVKISDRDGLTFGPNDPHQFGMTFTTFRDPILGYHFRSWSTLLIAETPSAPTIASVSPVTTAAAGALVTITGTNFTRASLVKFGAVAAHWFQVDDPTHIRTIMPEGASGSAAITVTTPGGVTSGFAYARS